MMGKIVHDGPEAKGPPRDNTRCVLFCCRYVMREVALRAMESTGASAG